MYPPTTIDRNIVFNCSWFFFSTINKMNFIIAYSVWVKILFECAHVRELCFIAAYNKHLSLVLCCVSCVSGTHAQTHTHWFPNPFSHIHSSFLMCVRMKLLTQSILLTRISITMLRILCSEMRVIMSITHISVFIRFVNYYIGDSITHKSIVLPPLSLFRVRLCKCKVC